MGERVPGTQVVSRSSSVLRAVSEFAPTGATTTEISDRTQLTRPTVHRLLSSLAAEGFLDHDSKRGRWHLGPELYLLGRIAADRYEITDTARDIVQVLAQKTGESAFLSARRGGQTVCLLREEGSFPVRSFVLYEGARFPLGVASAGMAILAFLPPAEIDAYLAEAELSDQYGPAHEAWAVHERITSTRRTGYALNPGLILEGSWGMGAAVFDTAGKPEWALSITGIESRFRPERQDELGRILLEQAHRLTRILQLRSVGR